MPRLALIFSVVLWAAMKRLCLALTVLSMMSSCSPKYYAPTLQNVPLFREKGEMRFAANIASGDEVGSTEFQGAYAFTDELGVMLNADFAHGDFDSHGFVVEGGGGYYRPIRQRLAFELYGGAGIGKAVNRYGSGDSPDVSDLRFSKFFVQPDFGIRRKFFEAAISTRFTGLHYYGIDTTVNTPGATIPDVEYIRSHASSLLAEPAFIVRAGHPSVKFQLQVSNSFNLTASDLRQEKTMIGFGLFISAKRQPHR